jgi:hypothetical protein
MDLRKAIPGNCREDVMSHVQIEIEKHEPGPHGYVAAIVRNSVLLPIGKA